MSIQSNYNVTKLTRKSVYFSIFFNKHQTILQNKKKHIFKKQSLYKQTSKFLVTSVLKKENQLKMYNVFLRELKFLIFLNNCNMMTLLHVTNMITKILLESLVIDKKLLAVNTFNIKIYKKLNNRLHLTLTEILLKKEIYLSDMFLDKKKLNLLRIENKYLTQNYNTEINVLNFYLIYTTTYFYNTLKHCKFLRYIWL